MSQDNTTKVKKKDVTNVAYQLSSTGVIRLEDSAAIPADPRNQDWKAYLAWVAKGNVPAAATVEDPNLLALSRSDYKMARISEDLIAALIKKKAINLTDLPQAAQTIYTERQAARAALDLTVVLPTGL